MLQKSIFSFVSYLQESKKYIWIFLFSQLFPACFYVINKNIQAIYKDSLIVELFNVAIFTLIFLSAFIALGFISKYFFDKGYKKILIALIILNFIGNGLELFIYLNFGIPIMEEMIPMFLETNANEAAEFFATYFNAKLIVLFLYIFIGVIMFLESRRYVLLTGLILSALTMFIGISFFNLPSASYIQKNHIYVRIWKNYHNYKRNVKDTERLMANYDERMKNIRVSDEADEATYVLIIGESFNKNYASLYGYPRETTPNMKKKYEDGNLFKFKDVVSPHNYTRDTLLKLVTEYAHDSDKKFAECANIIDLFKNAGYKTFWLSNQESFDDGGVGIMALINRSDVNEFVSKQLWQTKDETGLDDSNLLPLLNKALIDKDKKKFIIIHLYGSHPSYEKRYPKEFAYFNDNDEEEYFFDLQKRNKKMVNQYHNSLRFNDYVVNRIIEDVDEHSKNSFIIYLSDHGQLIYDDNKNLVGHVSPNLSVRSVEIPMVVWASDYYREHNKDKIERIKAAENKPFASEDVIYPIIDLANLKWDGYKPEKNLFEDSFKEKPRQVSSDGLIYKNDQKKDYVDIEDTGSSGH